MKVKSKPGASEGWRLRRRPYLLLRCCAPPSWLRRWGWSSVWVGGLWCCRPGWLPLAHMTARRSCHQTSSAEKTKFDITALLFIKKINVYEVETELKLLSWKENSGCIWTVSIVTIRNYDLHFLLVSSIHLWSLLIGASESTGLSQDRKNMDGIRFLWGCRNSLSCY